MPIYKTRADIQKSIFVKSSAWIMIIAQMKTTGASDQGKSAWSALRQFQNIHFVEKRLADKHNIDKKHMNNARKQAEQIRYCLIQAREYYDSAMSVSLATKPNLLYYSAMSLALAEILIKQSGDSSLDRARSTHKHHGLELKILSEQKTTSLSLEAAATNLAARPLVHSNGERFGTFELWHRSSREMPLGGDVVQHHPNGGTTTGFRIIMLPEEQRLPMVPSSGLTLFDCLSALPGMMEYLASHGIVSNLVRGKLSADVNNENGDYTSNHKILFHPTPKDVYNRFIENVKFDPKAITEIEYLEFWSGGSLSWKHCTSFGPYASSVPHGSQFRKDEIRFWPSRSPLNEFGYLYFSLYILGNYCRYYPDHWLRHVEENSTLALATEEFLRNVEARMALLSLSELSGIYHVPLA